MPTLYLGYDAHCSVCTRTGERIKSEVGENRDGSIEKSIGILDVEDNKIYRAYEIKRGQSTIETGAFVYSYIGQGSAKTLSSSINGAPPESLAPSAIHHAVLRGADPCGGCTGPGGPGDTSKISAEQCNEEIDVACALGLAGCVGCAAACAGTFGLACIFCITTSCGSFLAGGGCCKGDGSTHHVCKRCSAPL